MEPIDSEEKVAVPRATVAGGPIHVQVGHEKCAFYLTGDWKSGPVDMKCVHGTLADGGFYSEDHVNRIRVAAHQVLAAVDRFSGIKAQKKWVEALRELTR